MIENENNGKETVRKPKNMKTVYKYNERAELNK